MRGVDGTTLRDVTNREEETHRNRGIPEEETHRNRGIPEVGLRRHPAVPHCGCNGFAGRSESAGDASPSDC